MINKQKIVIASIARNIASTFSSDYERITAAFTDFKIVNWIIIESNSTDDSIKVLNDFSKHSVNILSIAMKNKSNGKYLRTQELAEARNMYLNIFRKINVKNDVKYLVVCDLNNLNNKLRRIAVNSCWDNKNWGAVTANQKGPYYDVWALRHKFWNDYDCWERYKEFLQFYDKPGLALWDSVYSRMIKIRSDRKWIQVDSAFGGIAIYKTKFIENCKYIGVSTNGQQICEHVSFNAGVIKNGGSIFINPKFINFKLTDHSRRKKYFQYYNLKFYLSKTLKSVLHK